MIVPRIDGSITYTQKYQKRNTKPIKYNKKVKSSSDSNLASEALKSAGAWFGFGVGLDLVSRKIPLSKSPTKNSILTNGIIAAIVGIYTLIHGMCSNHKK